MIAWRVVAVCLKTILCGGKYIRVGYAAVWRRMTAVGACCYITHAIRGGRNVTDDDGEQYRRLACFLLQVKKVHESHGFRARAWNDSGFLSVSYNDNGLSESSGYSGCLRV